MNISFDSFDSKELKAVTSQFKLKKYTEGEKTLKFEKELSKYFNRKYCVCVNSGSSANFLIFKSLNLINKIKKDKKKYAVAISGLCWPTTVTAILDSGFEVFFCDIDKETLNLDLDFLEKHKPSNLKYIVSTPVMGNPNGTDEIKKYCKEKKLILIEDACESFGAKTFENKIGNVGISSSFSFYFSHHLTTIEGGAVLTDDILQYNLLKSLKSHGWSRGNDLKKILKIREKNYIDSRWDFLIPGYNLRTNDINSSIGLVQLKKIKSFLKKRKIICDLRINKIRNKNIKIIGIEDNIQNTWMGFPILIKDLNIKIKLLKKLEDNYIDYRPIIAGNVKNHYVNKFYGKTKKISLKNCNYVMKRGLVLPVHPFITKKANEKLIEILNLL